MSHRFLLALSLTLILILSVLDLCWGTFHISLSDALEALLHYDEQRTVDYLIVNFRLPKVLTAIFVGSGISMAGLMMQCMFHNPLADTSILGISSGAGLGVALYTMAFSLFPALYTAGIVNSWGMVLAAFLGALSVLMIISMTMSVVRSVTSILIIGVMIGFIASGFISVLQFFSDEEALKGYLLWSFGSLTGTTWRQLAILIPIVTLGLGSAMLLPKYMNALSLGERYARSVGINPQRAHTLLILTTSLIAGSITAFVGPIAFLGLAVPHLARMILATSNHRTLIPATILLGAILMLVCDILTQVPGKQFILPINAITSLIGAPIVISILLRGRSIQSA